MAGGSRFSLLFLLGNLCLVAASASAPYVIQTAAGSDFTGDGGPALSAVLTQAEGIAVDGQGVVYVADADDNRVRRIAPDGTIQTVAGTGVSGFSGDGGPAKVALLSHPYGLAVDKSGSLYIADLGNARVRKVTTDGLIHTIAGGGAIAPGHDGFGGPALDAQLLQPRNVAVDGAGSIYISDFGVHRVYRVSGGILVTIAGSGDAGFSGDGDSALLAQLNAPAGLAVDPNGVLYIADSGNNSIRRVYNSVISTVYSVIGPTGLAVGPDGSLYIAAASYFGTLSGPIAGVPFAKDVAVDQKANVYTTTGQFVLEVSSAGVVSAIAGSGASRYFGGDQGPAALARLHAPSDVAVDNKGNWYITDASNNRIRKVTREGIITTLAGTGDAGSGGDNGPASLAQLNRPVSLAIDLQQNLYVADSGNNAVRKITPDGLITPVVADLNNPQSVAVDAQGSLYIADTGNNRILKLTPAGAASTLTEILQPIALAVASDGGVLVSDSRQIWKVTPAGDISLLIGGLNSALGLAVTTSGDVLIAETGLNVIRRLAPSGVLSILAGTGIAGFSGDGGPATFAQLNAPIGLAIGPTGSIWIADSANNRVRTLQPAAPGSVPAGLPVENAASLKPGPVAPGEIISIFGAGFDPQHTQVLFDHNPTTVFYAGATQINALAPVGLTPAFSTEITILVDGSAITDFSIPVAAAVPGIFTTGNGTGPVAANNEDGSINSASNPAARGSIVSLYATGQGLDLSNVSVTIADYPAQVLYAGPAPGYLGLMQINVQVPDGFLPPGIQPVGMMIGNIASQPGVTVALR